MVFSCFVVLSLFKEITMLTRSTGIITRGHEGVGGGGGRRSQSRVGLGRGDGGGVICSTLTALVECPNHFIIDGNIFKQGFPQNFNATLRYFPSTVFYNAFSCSKVGLGLYRPTRSRPLNNLKDRISFFPSQYVLFLSPQLEF